MTPGGGTGTPSGGTDAGGTTGTTGGGEDGGSGNDGAAVVTFLGETTPWVATQQPATSAAQSMATGTVVQPTPTLDCMATCHVAGGTAPPYLAAGFVATTPGGTTGASNVEVRVYAAGSDAGISAYTDVNGYFWINPPIGGLTGPYNAGVRGGTGTPTIMPAAQTTIDCQSSSCHGGTADGNIHCP